MRGRRCWRRRWRATWAMLRSCASWSACAAWPRPSAPGRPMRPRLLRRRAAAKFANAAALYFTREALEQASGATIAAYRARRYQPYGVVADLCCGAGGDALALAQVTHVAAVDRDPLRLAMALANARACGLDQRITLSAGRYRADAAAHRRRDLLRPGAAERWAASLCAGRLPASRRAGRSLAHTHRGDRRKGRAWRAGSGAGRARGGRGRVYLGGWRAEGGRAVVWPARDARPPRDAARPTTDHRPPTTDLETRRQGTGDRKGVGRMTTDNGQLTTDN